MKKPNNLTLVNILRFTADDHRKHDEEVAKYQLYVLKRVCEEAQSKDLIEIIFYLTEKFHPTLKIRHKRGAKTKWAEFLNAMIAVEVQSNRDSGILLKEAIWKVAKENRWKALIKNTSDEGYGLINRAYKNGKKNKSYIVAKKAYALSEKGEKPFNWDETARNTVKKALSKD